MKNVVLAILLGIFLGIGVLYFRGSRNPSSQLTSNETPQPTTQDSQNPNLPQEEGTVVYTNEGFSPRELRVSAGTRVVFVNNSDKSMWVASDPHPVHTGLPAFDQKRGVEQGETYSFVFKNAGQYSYHNHLSPQDGGVIIVE